MIDTPPIEATRPQVEQAIVAWRAKRAERLEAQRLVDAMQKEESALKSWLIAVFKEQAYEGMVIESRITGLSTREVHSVVDRDALVNYIYENEAIDLLQFRLSESAVGAREEVGQTVPGLDIVEVYDIFDRKS